VDKNNAKIQDTSSSFSNFLSVHLLYCGGLQVTLGNYGVSIMF